MKKAFIGLAILVVVTIILLSYIAIPHTPDRADCRLITGKVERIVADSNTAGYDISFYLSGTKRSYYINRGVQQKLPLQDWQKQLTNNEVTIAYYKNSTHICELLFNNTVLYSEFKKANSK